MKFFEKYCCTRWLTGFYTFQLFLLLLLVVVAVEAQTSDTVDPDTPIKINTTLLNIPLVVNTRDGKSVAGLTKENFTVLRSGKKENIEFFASDSAPMCVALILDASPSTSPVIGRITRAARDFLAVLGPKDQAMIVSFAAKATVEQPFTSDQAKLRGAIGDVYVSDSGGSNMNDAVHRVLTKDFKTCEGRKAMVVLTDGEVWGKITNEELKDILIESDVVVYPIFYYVRGLFPRGTKSISYAQLFETRPGKYLNSLATLTGGRVYAADGNDFSGAFKNVADELKSQYVIGIHVDSEEDSKDIKIKVDRDGAIVRAKGILRPKRLTPGEALK